MIIEAGEKLTLTEMSIEEIFEVLNGAPHDEVWASHKAKSAAARNAKNED